MIVVADSGPLHYLILLEHIELLRRFKAIPITKPKTKIVAIVSALNRWSASQPGT